MSLIVPSYLLKMQRAEKHLAEAEGIIADYVESHPYEVGVGVADEHGRSIRTLRFTKQPSDDLAIVIGDFVHNVRSGLNHLAAACTPRENWKKVQFPIFSSDSFEKDPATGDFLHQGKRGTDARSAWKNQITGMSGEAVAAFKRLQPFDPGIEDPRFHGLALVEGFSNTDKHRELLILGFGLRDATLTFILPNGERVQHLVRGDLNNGAQITGRATIGPEVQVQITGTPLVVAAIGEQHGYVELPRALRIILEACRNDAIPALTPYAIYG